MPEISTPILEFLELRCHRQSIDFNAADTEMAVALQALPNVGSVSVTRTGPDGQLGYSWYVTFVENPGYFPAGSGDVALLSTDSSSLQGGGVWCAAEEVSSGSPELSGGFVLAFTGSADSGGVTRYTDELPYNSLAEEVWDVVLWRDIVRYGVLPGLSVFVQRQACV